VAPLVSVVASVNITGAVGVNGYSCRISDMHLSLAAKKLQYYRENKSLKLKWGIDLCFQRRATVAWG
jgi:hypothetical protein